MSEPIVELKGVTKRFSGIFALRGVDFALQQGEIHALCGENGAGKSTLIKILSGVHPHHSFEGSYLLDGREAAFASVRDSQARGLAVIYQELPLVEEMSQTLLSRFGIQLDPERKVSSLGPGQKQLVEIARALRNRSRVLILDEPTAALTERESEALLQLLRELRREGQSILYISHRLHEVMAIADHITVLRDGQSVFSAPSSETTPALLVHKMVGRELGELFPARPSPSPDREVVLDVRDLSVSEGRDQPPRLRNLTLQLHAGEIVGIYGLLGAGRSVGCSPVGNGDAGGGGTCGDKPRRLDCRGPAPGERGPPPLWAGDGSVGAFQSDAVFAARAGRRWTYQPAP
jgi:ABC-type sugar transport system ATPase subunit